MILNIPCPDAGTYKVDDTWVSRTFDLGTYYPDPNNHGRPLDKDYFDFTINGFLFFNYHNPIYNTHYKDDTGLGSGGYAGGPAVRSLDATGTIIDSTLYPNQQGSSGLCRDFPGTDGLLFQNFGGCPCFGFDTGFGPAPAGVRCALQFYTEVDGPLLTGQSFTFVIPPVMTWIGGPLPVLQ